jgi:NitT/TauT family transport system substrate-binding protein
MPAGGPKASLATEQLVGNVKSSVDLSKTFTNDFAIQANKTEGFKTTTTPAGPNG